MPDDASPMPAPDVHRDEAAGDAPTIPSATRLLAKAGAEFGPLLALFVANEVAGIFWATGVFMIATAIAAGLSWWKERRLPLVPVVSLAFVIALGGLTLLTDDPIWILIRPTILNGGFAVLLFVSVAVGRPGLKRMLDGAVRLDAAGWRGLTLRVALFLTALAVMNEIVWRNLGVDAWVAYKTFVVLPANAVFLVSQWPFVQRHRPAR